MGIIILYGQGLSRIFLRAVDNCSNNTATIFGYYVNYPKRYGVIDFNLDGKALSILEKPSKLKSNFTFTGLNIYLDLVVNIAKAVKPSEIGRVVNPVKQEFSNKQVLEVELLGRGFV